MTMCMLGSVDGDEDEDFEVITYANDMQLRDYFAGQALTGLLAGGSNEYFDDNIAELSYALADAMMRRRERKEDE